MAKSKKSNTRVRKLDMVSEVGGWGYDMEYLRMQLGYNDDEFDEIQLPINSYGGSALEGLSIYNFLKGRKETVRTQVLTHGISAGVITFLSGEIREMPENGFLMIHEGMVDLIYAKKREVEDGVKMMEVINNSIALSIESNTNLSYEDAREMMEGDFWMSAEEAMDFGFCTNFTDPINIVNSLSGLDKNIYGKIPNNYLKTTKYFDMSGKKLTLKDKVLNFFDGGSGSANKQGKGGEGSGEKTEETNFDEIKKMITDLDEKFDARFAEVEEGIVEVAEKSAEVHNSFNEFLDLSNDDEGKKKRQTLKERIKNGSKPFVKKETTREGRFNRPDEKK
jgi:ATP-dependent protease ClpP protease subunit